MIETSVAHQRQRLPSSLLAQATPSNAFISQCSAVEKQLLRFTWPKRTSSFIALISLVSNSNSSSRPLLKAVTYIFLAFKGFRERLHGHNYKAAVRLYGSPKISHDGYVIDFGDIKKVTRKLCKELNEHFICPMYSDVIEICDGGSDGPLKKTLTLNCEDGSTFVFPKDDCAMLPIVHSTAEELAVYLWSRILRELDADFLLKRGIHTLEVIIAEAVNQEAVFRSKIPEDGNVDLDMDVRRFLMEHEVEPQPCLPVTEATSKNPAHQCCPLCKNTLKND